MASLLVRVERAVLDAIRTREQAELQPGELPHPELSYLDPNSVAFVVYLEGKTLRCGMTVHEPMLERGKLVGGDVLLHDSELTPILQRLGCYSDVATWSAVPHILPPNDVDLLRYHLNLPLDARRNLVLEPTVVAAEDEIDREILSEIWANPTSDAPRMIYADRLQQRADPRGELIAMQLARGNGRITDRERELVAKWGPACTRPLTNFFTSYELRRGFLSRAVVDLAQPIPPSLLEHPMWSLVEELHTAHPSVLRLAPLTSLRTLRTRGANVAAMSSYARTYPKLEQLLGLPSRSESYAGVSIGNITTLQQICETEAWPALRVFSVDTVVREGAMIPAAILRSTLGHQLAHLDLTVRPGSLDPHALFTELARSKTIQRVSLVARMDGDPFVLLYDRRPDNTFALTLQVAPHRPQAIPPVLAWLTPLTRGIDQIAITYVPDRDRRHDPEADQGLIEWLQRAFARVDVVEELRRPLCPWAY